MSNLRTTIETLSSQLASSILDALRSASIDELADIAGGNSHGARRGRPASNSKSDSDSDGGSARRGAGGAGRLGRRSADDIAKMVESIVEAVEGSENGLRAEEIREALGVEAKELPRPLAEALASGRVTKSGQKRATTYFAAGGGDPSKRRGRPVKKV